jgi:thiamine biosynthesis lipoprotein
MSACVDLRRARPLLGTFVEIAVAAASRAAGDAAIDAAFRAVARVHRRMSFHAPDSDVSRLNAAAPGQDVAVDPWTWDVLHAAEEFRRRSDGLFDVAIAPWLQAQGVLPGTPSVIASEAKQSRLTSLDCFVPRRGARGPRNDDSLALLPNHVVRRLSARARIDLGGIAKGFAVDRAVDVLRARGIARGVVNAGGDLFVFGAVQPVALRDPRNPGRLLGRIAVADRALASSALAVPGGAPSAVVDPRNGRRAGAAVGATVLAPAAMTADALTKLVLLQGGAALPMLAAHRAEALFVAQSGEVRVTTGWPEALAHAA